MPCLRVSQQMIIQPQIMERMQRFWPVLRHPAKLHDPPQLPLEKQAFQIERRILPAPAQVRRTHEEIDRIRAAIGPEVPILGYYTYGEYCRIRCDSPSYLHNETVTVTVIGM